MNIIFILFLIIPITTGWVANIIGLQNSEHPNKCIDSKTTKMYNHGDIWSNFGECNQYFCLIREPNKFMIKMTGCIKVQAGEGCYEILDPLLNYPDCCPKVICK